MQNRHYLLDALQQAILASNVDIATSLINEIDKHKININYFDETETSLLNYALKQALKPIATHLFQQSDTDSIFNENPKNRSCLYFAAEHGYLDIATKIIQLSKALDPAVLGYKSWLKCDAKGNTPLHATTMSREIQLTNLLLNEIQHERDAQRYVNWLNHDENTPLHLACLRHHLPCDTDAIALLIQHGADITLNNMQAESPLSLMLNFTLEELTAIFKQLDNDHQLYFLDHYRQFILEQTNNENILNSYLRLSSIYSLRSFILAKIEFDEAFDKPKAIVETEATLNPYDMFIDTTQTECKSLSKDHDTLKKLIDDIELYVTNLPNRSNNLSPLSIAAITISITFSLMLYIGIESMLGIFLHKDDNKRHKSDYILGVILFGVLGFMFAATANIALGFYLSQHSKLIPREEWQDFLDQLEEHIVKNLQQLEAQEIKDKLLDPSIQYLPTAPATIRDLENSLNRLSADNTERKDTLINLLTDLTDILKELKRDMALTNKPFSLFYQPNHLAISMSDSDSSLVNDTDDSLSLEEISGEDEQAIPLLRI